MEVLKEHLRDCILSSRLDVQILQGDALVLSELGDCQFYPHIFLRHEPACPLALLTCPAHEVERVMRTGTVSAGTLTNLLPRHSAWHTVSAQ